MTFSRDSPTSNDWRLTTGVETHGVLLAGSPKRLKVLDEITQQICLQKDTSSQEGSGGSGGVGDRDPDLAPIPGLDVTKLVTHYVNEVGLPTCTLEALAPRTHALHCAHACDCARVAS
jgi:hypothetical protein